MGVFEKPDGNNGKKCPSTFHTFFPLRFSLFGKEGATLPTGPKGTDQ